MYSRVFVDAALTGLADVDIARRIDAHGVHGIRFPARDHCSVSIPDTDRRLTGVSRLLAQIERPVRIARHVIRTAHAGPHADELAVGRENLDPLVRAVADV